MSDYKPKLSMAQFKKVKREYTEEQMNDEIRRASARFMEPEVMHDVKIAGIVKDSVKFNETNPTWLQVGFILENAAGEIANHYIMVPCGPNVEFISRTGKPTAMPLANYGHFLTVLGLVEYKMAIIDKIIQTDCEALNGFIGFQLRYIAKWNKKKVHPQFDQSDNCWRLVDAQGRIADEDPFQIPSRDEVEKPEDRWAEMALRAQELGLGFETQATGMLMANPQIVNPINQLGLIKVAASNAAAIEKAHAQSAPKVATIAKKAVAKTQVAAKKTPPPPPVEEEVEEEEEEVEFEEDEMAMED